MAILYFNLLVCFLFEPFYLLGMSLPKAYFVCLPFLALLLLQETMFVMAEEGPVETCQRRQRDRLGPVKKQCCLKIPYSTCISHLCSSNPNANRCEKEQSTCKTALNEACGEYPDIVFNAQCHGLSKNILIQDTWHNAPYIPENDPVSKQDAPVSKQDAPVSKQPQAFGLSLSPRVRSSSLVSPGVIIGIFLGVILLSIGAVLVYCYCRKAGKKPNRKLSPISSRHSSRKATMEKPSKKRKATQSVSLEKGHDRVLVDQASHSKGQQASGTAVHRGASTGNPIVDKSKSKQQVTAPDCTQRSKPALVTSQSFNSRAVNTVHRPKNAQANARPILTYTKFRKALN